MAKLTFKYTESDVIESNREASEITFLFPDELDIHEFKCICIRLAAAMGYSEKTILNSFGDIV